MERGRGEKVPMQPRSRWEEGCWEEGVRVFQVMNIGAEGGVFLDVLLDVLEGEVWEVLLPLELEVCSERYWA